MNKDTRLSDVLHVLLHLDQEKEPVTSDTLAQSIGTNPAVFRRTIAGLRNAGYVQSGKGHGGGWTLARPLSRITLLDVYRALGEPSLFAFGNRSDRPDCRIERKVNRALADTMTQAEELFVKRFRAVTLDALLPDKRTFQAAHCEREGN